MPNISFTNSEIITVVSSLVVAILGGFISYILNRQTLHNSLMSIREQFKTEYAAETAVRHFLEHEGYTDRSFEVLQKHLGGFEGDELRRILVRAGAIRVPREDGTEWWRLLEREKEYLARIKKNSNR